MVRRYLPEYGDYEKQDKFDKIPWDKKKWNLFATMDVKILIILLD